MVVSLNGLGTKSARIAFENCCFLEIIAPDPKQTYRPLGDKLTHLEPGKLVPLHYAVRNKDAEELKDEDWSDLGFSCDKVTMVAKDRGMPWQWDLYFLEGHDDGGIVPYFTHWGKSHHAAGRLPILGSLDKVTVRAPADNKVHKLLEEVKGLTTEEGDNFFEFTFTSKTGSHTFSGSSLIGVSFPLAGGIPVQE